MTSPDRTSPRPYRATPHRRDSESPLLAIAVASLFLLSSVTIGLCLGTLARLVVCHLRACP